MPECLFATGALQVPVWTALPFVLLLAAVAVLPLVAGRWWHRHHTRTALGEHRNKALVTALLVLPATIYLLAHEGGTRAIFNELKAYASFIVLLTALYTISGGLVLRGSFPATPVVNTGLLFAGALLANLIGTTGASLLLIRPMLRINRHRPRRTHVPIFFLFVVSNTGGLLTPLGDPPLFLGFLDGVDFFWTLRLWPQWLLVNGSVLILFALWDWRIARDEDRTARQGNAANGEPFRLEGVRRNGPLMACVILAVLGRKFVPFPVAELVMLACTLASVAVTPRDLRAANRYSWGPMVEVAILFLGVFATMVPALALLHEHRAAFGIAQPWQFFWVTGLLSSVLDNAPTYLTIGTLAANGQNLGTLMAERPDLLAAVSCGAVFMGANSYIGNGPNFMVKALAEEDGYRMPSFSAYALIAATVLGPLYGLVTLLFFL